MHQLMEITRKSDVCMKTCDLVFGLQGGSISKSLKVMSNVTTHQMEIMHQFYPNIRWTHTSDRPTHLLSGCHVSGKTKFSPGQGKVREF